MAMPGHGTHTTLTASDIFFNIFQLGECFGIIGHGNLRSLEEELAEDFQLDHRLDELKNKLNCDRHARLLGLSPHEHMVSSSLIS